MIFSNVDLAYGEKAVYTVSEDGLTVSCHVSSPVRSDFSESESVYEILRNNLGFDSGAAEFACDWIDGIGFLVSEKCRYFPYDWMTVAQMTEKETAEYLEYLGVSEEEYEERYGSIFRDAAFSGAIVLGE